MVEVSDESAVASFFQATQDRRTCSWRRADYPDNEKLFLGKFKLLNGRIYASRITAETGHRTAQHNYNIGRMGNLSAYGPSLDSGIFSLFMMFSGVTGDQGVASSLPQRFRVH